MYMYVCVERNKNILPSRMYILLATSYCSPSRVTSEIPFERIMFVLAMDNDTNKIVGIGMVRNHEYINKYTVYQNSNYNI